VTSLADPLQIEDMDAQQIAERHVVERYLAGHLSEGEALAFEAYIEAHPEIIRDIEDVARMKFGLATLKKRGNLPSLVEHRGSDTWRRPALIAAAIAVLALGLFVFAPAWKQNPESALIAATIRGLAGDAHPPGAISSVVLSRTRSLTPETLHPSSKGSFVQVTLELFAENASSNYSVQLMQIVDGKLQSLARLNDQQVNAEGNLVIYLREDSLSAENYVFRVSTPGEATTADYSLRVAR